MKKNTKILIGVGAIALIGGAYFYFTKKKSKSVEDKEKKSNGEPSGRSNERVNDQSGIPVVNEDDFNDGDIGDVDQTIIDEGSEQPVITRPGVESSGNSNDEDSVQEPLGSSVVQPSLNTSNLLKREVISASPMMVKSTNLTTERIASFDGGSNQVEVGDMLTDL